ncbi:MAG: DUF6370 family protein [Planctomycetota bacterium]
MSKGYLQLSLSMLLLVGFVGCKAQDKESAPPSAAEPTPAAKPANVAKPAKTAAPVEPAKIAAITDREVEAGCGMCIFKMAGVTGCKLAVKIDGKPYLVEGSDVNAHTSGLCGVSKKAVVSGKIKGNVFVATSFKLSE